MPSPSPQGSVYAFSQRGYIPCRRIEATKFNMHLAQSAHENLLDTAHHSQMCLLRDRRLTSM